MRPSTTFLVVAALSLSLLLSCSSRSNSGTQPATVASSSPAPSNESGLQFKSPKVLLDFSDALNKQAIDLADGQKKKCVFVCDEWDCTGDAGVKKSGDTVHCVCKRGHTDCS